MEYEQLAFECACLKRRLQTDYSHIDGGDEYPFIAQCDSFMEQYGECAKTEFDPFVARYLPYVQQERNRWHDRPNKIKGGRECVKQGTLIYSPDIDGMDIRFGLGNYHGGLQCGQCFEVFDGYRWVPTSIEYSDGWHLAGIQAESIEGLRVRITGGGVHAD